MSQPGPVSSMWTAWRGAQHINCELIQPGTGHAILRCGFGPQSIIRSQFIFSADAAAEVAERWKADVIAHGFRIVPGSSES